MKTKPYRIGYKMVPVYVIPVQIAKNEQDYEFVFVNGNKRKKVMAVF